MYHWADALVGPSICEGSVLVSYEALACGLPVITTPNAGSVVRDGRDGFVVPIRDSDAIGDCLNRLLVNRELLTAMSVSALERSREFTLERYGERLIELLTSILGQ
jgi:glycosyltransferase involved in cell wall biosynthesis